MKSRPIARPAPPRPRPLPPRTPGSAHPTDRRKTPSATPSAGRRPAASVLLGSPARGGPRWSSRGSRSPPSCRAGPRSLRRSRRASLPGPDWRHRPPCRTGTPGRRSASGRSRRRTWPAAGWNRRCRSRWPPGQGGPPRQQRSRRWSHPGPVPDPRDYGPGRSNCFRWTSPSRIRPCSSCRASPCRPLPAFPRPWRRRERRSCPACGTRNWFSRRACRKCPCVPAGSRSAARLRRRNAHGPPARPAPRPALPSP